MASSSHDYTKVNTADNMRVCSSLAEAKNPKEFVALILDDKPKTQMDLRLDSMVKLYLEPTDSE